MAPSLMPNIQPTLNLPDLTPLNIIRTETVVSRFPIHNLAKRGKVAIHIKRTNDQGDLDLHWAVSYNDYYGPPRQLAYKLDTIVINQIIDDLPRPLPRLLKIGSLRYICTLLDLNGSGRQQADLKKAFHQNASAYIVAKLRYRGRDGTEQLLEAGFTRYSVIFTGEQLPDGTKADAVYLNLKDEYLEVLNQAPVRPLDYDYLKALPPMAQRFYEILSYRIFAALKYRHSHATLRYSDYCMFSTQQRYCHYDQVKKQMYKVHRPHVQSGYLAKVHYETLTDSEGHPDWLMSYIPGPKALAEYAVSMRQASNDAQAISFPSFQEIESVTLSTSPDHALPETRDLPATTEVMTRSSSAKECPDVEAAMELVRQFYTRFLGTVPLQPSAKELTQARHLLEEHGLDRARYVIEFSARVAPETQYHPQTFGGILHYVPRALAAYEAHNTSAPQKQREQHTQALWERYAQWKQDELARLRGALAPEELTDIETEVRQQLLAEGTPQFALGLSVRIAVDELLETRAGLPPFEAWKPMEEPRISITS